MTMWLRTTAICILAAGLAFGQQASSGSSPATVVRSGQLGAAISAGGGGGGVFFYGGAGPAITGKPYSAEQETVRDQTLADGTHIVHSEGTAKLYRDSEGRMRMERSFPLPPGAVGTPVTFIEITDPAEGYRYVLNERNHTAQRMRWMIKTQGASAGGTRAVISGAPPPPSLPAPTPNGGIMPHVMVAAGPQGLHTEWKHESLGNQSIEGVLADGSRATMTYPAGIMGNDRPFTTTQETWFSRDLGLMMLSKSSDPRYGDTTTTTKNVVLSEPDPSLFEVPADYKVEER